jgi:penicillin-binding protein 2
MGGARAAAPVAKDVLTFLFDRKQAVDRLHALEAEWGGNIAERMAAKAQAWKAAQAPQPPTTAVVPEDPAEAAETVASAAANASVNAIDSDASSAGAQEPVE